MHLCTYNMVEEVLDFEEVVGVDEVDDLDELRKILSVKYLM